MATNPENDRRFQSYVINRMVPFPVIAKKAHLDGEYDYHSSVFCPFHENYDTPAAKLYHDDDRGDALFCFAEQKTYRVADVFSRNLIDTSMSIVFQNLWNQLDEGTRQALRDGYDRPVAYMPESWDKHEKELQRFKRGRCSWEDHLNTLVNAISE